MPRGFIKNVVSAAVAVLFFASLALADKGKVVAIYTDAVLPDGQTLKAGKYNVVVSEDGKEVQFLQGGKVVAKHSSKCVEQTETTRHTQARYVEDKGKKQCLREIRFAGQQRVVVLEAAQGM